MCPTFILFYTYNVQHLFKVKEKHLPVLFSLPPSHLPSIPPSFSLWSLPLEQIRAKWNYRVSAPLTNVYRTDGAEQPFNNAEWILLLGSATFPTFLPRVLLQFLWQEERHEGKRERGKERWTFCCKQLGEREEEKVTHRGRSWEGI